MIGNGGPSRGRIQGLYLNLVDRMRHGRSCDTVSFVKLGLTRSAVTNQIAFDQRDLHSTLEFERAIDRSCQVLVSKLETLGTITFP